MRIIFVPGVLGNADLWKPTLQRLNGKYDCQVFDITNGETIEELSNDLKNSFCGPVILVGLSFGARVALHAYSLLRDRCHRLILISSAPGNLTESTRKLFITYIHQIESGQFEKFIQADYEHDVADINKNCQLKNTLTSMMRTQGPNSAIKHFNAMLNSTINFSELELVECPTLLIRGDCDHSINVQRQEQICHKIPNAELAVIPEAGHYIPLERPVAMLEIIQQWLMK